MTEEEYAEEQDVNVPLTIALFGLATIGAGTIAAGIYKLGKKLVHTAKERQELTLFTRTTSDEAPAEIE